MTLPPDISVRSVSAMQLAFNTHVKPVSRGCISVGSFRLFARSIARSLVAAPSIISGQSSESGCKRAYERQRGEKLEENSTRETARHARFFLRVARAPRVERARFYSFVPVVLAGRIGASVHRVTATLATRTGFPPDALLTPLETMILARSPL